MKYLLRLYIASGSLCRNDALTALYCFSIIVYQMSKACPVELAKLASVGQLLHVPDKLLNFCCQQIP